jgi:hypothetical protein
MGTPKNYFIGSRNPRQKLRIKIVAKIIQKNNTIDIFSTFSLKKYLHVCILAIWFSQNFSGNS